PPVLVLVNTASGTLSDPAERDRLAALLPDAHIVELTGDTDLDQELARDSSDIVVAAGGDGTVNAVAGRLAGTERILGVIAGGTLNPFARDLRIPLDLADAV